VNISSYQIGLRAKSFEKYYPKQPTDLQLFRKLSVVIGTAGWTHPSFQNATVATRCWQFLPPSARNYEKNPDNARAYARREVMTSLQAGWTATNNATPGGGENSLLT
jgi:hypothetical protein